MKELTPEQELKLQGIFLDAYRAKGAIGPALKLAEVSRERYRAWKEDEDFLQRLKDAEQDAVDDAIEELRIRGIHGRDKLLFYMGSPIWRRDPATGEVLLDDNFEPIAYTENERSDSLLLAYIKAKSREFQDKNHLELSGPDGGNVPMGFVVEYVLPDGKTIEDYERQNPDGSIRKPEEGGEAG